MPFSPAYRPAPRILALGEGFFDEVQPAVFPQQILRFRNDRHAETIGLETLTMDEWTDHFARFVPLPDNLQKPLALRYHGHQFDVYNPNLGDGRGFLHAQIQDGQGRLLDLGTKGSGRTPWSRGGDGRLTLKGGMREVLATEMLEALGVNTSKTFSLFETGEHLMRGDEPSPTRSSVMVRLSHSHIRIGSFQRHAYAKDVERIQRLFDYSIAQYYPALAAISEPSERVLAFVSEVARANATLCASLMVAGFVHGVLNSDNLTITGESFDYGPYRFLPRYDLSFTAAYFDEGGLYAYGHQPRAFFRNMTRLADSLRLLAPEVAFGPSLSVFEDVLETEVIRLTLDKLGVKPAGHELDRALTFAIYEFLGESHLGFEMFFHQMQGGLQTARAQRFRAEESYKGPEWDALVTHLEIATPARETLPARFEKDLPCTLLIDEIESIWSAIDTKDDWSPFAAKIAEIRAMGANR